MNLNSDFYDHVKRAADMDSTEIDAADVARVLSQAAKYLNTLPPCDAMKILAEWLHANHD